MKISIGTKIKDGPWGGGNLFAINLKQHLINKGHIVIHDLKDRDIDLVLITEPRKTSESSAFTNFDVLNYLSYINRDTLVSHRINECDERKGTKYVNKYIINANKVSDSTIYVSSWIKDIYINQGIDDKQNKVILSGSDSSIFNRNNFKKWNKNEKFKIVTHHWGANWMKGFDIYEKIDNLLDNSYWSNLIEFTYIGNTPKDFKFKNANVVSPKAGFELANEIKKNNLYITGSLNEPSGNHHIEGAQCGLPVMYVESGGIPEYCEGFGNSFSLKNLEDKLLESMNNYEDLYENMKNYKLNSEKMSEEYEEFFLQMLQNKSKLLKRRNIIFNNNYLKKLIYKAVN